MIRFFLQHQTPAHNLKQRTNAPQPRAPLADGSQEDEQRPEPATHFCLHEAGAVSGTPIAALETSAPGHSGSRRGRSVASTASSSVVRYRSTPEATVLGPWLL